MSKIPLKLSAALTCGCCAQFLAVSGAASMSDIRPNIVLIMSDDQGWADTAYNGHPDLKTPVLDEMARTGLRFDRFYAASPMCSPTRASVMTGRHANRSGAFWPNWSTRPEEVTLAHVLQRAGYHTGHFGKWHIGAVKKESPLNPRAMGFDEYLSHDNFFGIDPVFSRNGAPPEVFKGESSEILVGEAVKFINKVRTEEQPKPFFVVLWFGSPHWPFAGLPEDVALYEHVSDPELRHRYAEITAMDRAIGKFREAIREAGVADNTLVWFNSDNGTGVPARLKTASFNGPWRGRKSDLYEGGLRVPAIIEWPAVIREHRATSVPCVTSDIFPTVLDLLGISSRDPRRPLDGISLKPILVSGQMTERPRPSPIGFWNYPFAAERDNPRWVDRALSQGTTPTENETAVDFTNTVHPAAKTRDFGGDAAWTDNRYKLLVFGSDSTPRVELYDLLSDLGEEHNLAAEQPDMVRRMTAQLEAWQRSVELSLSGADYVSSEPPPNG
ncbi:MAG: sulfatase-like hydrolase/transferase [Opitutaceae bacterium]|nr:sulfatase-like hydrolase/transferase [Opitutaceae bacterium]